MVDVYPRSNLPDRSVDWGRAIENQNQKTAQDIEILRAKFESDSRYLAGQMGAVSRNLQGIEKVVQGLRGSTDELQGVTDDASSALSELQTRSSISIPIPNISNTLTVPPGTSMGFSNSETFFIPPPEDGTDRDAFFFFSAEPYISNPSAAIVTLAAEISIGSTIMQGISHPNPTASVPPGLVIPLSFMTRVSVSRYGTYGTLRYAGEMFRVTNDPPASSTTGFRNIIAFVVIGDEI